MKIIKRKNGYYYLYISRDNIRSLKTKGKAEAKGLLAIEKEKASAAMAGDVARIRGITLQPFADEYLAGRRHLVSINEL